MSFSALNLNPLNRKPTIWSLCYKFVKGFVEIAEQSFFPPTKCTITKYLCYEATRFFFCNIIGVIIKTYRLCLEHSVGITSIATP